MLDLMLWDSCLRVAINFAIGAKVLECCKLSEYSNGNGALMMFLPIAFMSRNMI